MSEDFKTYLEKIKFERYFKKLKHKIGRKTVIIYGTGTLFRYIQEHYDLCSLNVIGISDMKFSELQEGEKFLGYNIIPKTKIAEYKPDYVLVATLSYIGIIEDFILNYFDGTKTKVFPLARIPLWSLIKEIWSK